MSSKYRFYSPSVGAGADSMVSIGAGSGSTGVSTCGELVESTTGVGRAVSIGTGSGSACAEASAEVGASPVSSGMLVVCSGTEADSAASNVSLDEGGVVVAEMSEESIDVVVVATGMVACSSSGISAFGAGVDAAGSN